MYRNIVLHWTAGCYKPCSIDFDSYHYLIDNLGNVYKGKYEPNDNLNCKDGNYAKHCGGGNTGRIGIAICCMKDKMTPPIKKQVEALCNLSAQLCTVYGLQPDKCITHAEFGQQHPKTSSAGKRDIDILPFAHLEGVKPCAEYLRNKIQWYYNKIKGV